MSIADSPAPKLTTIQWLVCVIAAIGFLFDTYELLVLPLVAVPAVGELAHAKPGTPDFDFWYKMLFYLPAVCGGVFGLLGGYLTDRLGRRRVLTWSIVLYAASALAAGFCTSMPWLVFFRVTTFIGVCVEFVAAIAWLAELFPHPRQREKVLGYTQAFSSFGGLLVAQVYHWCQHNPESLAAIHDFLHLPAWGANLSWRFTLMSGLIPALPLILIRPFLPESPTWKLKKMQGALRRPSIAELFRPEYRRATIVTTIMFACSLGVAFGSIQHFRRVLPSLHGVTVEGVDKLTPIVQTYQEFGGLLGRCLMAVLALYIVSRQRLIRLFQIPGLIITPLVFYFAPGMSPMMFQIGMFLVGFMAVAQLSFWGNYLPRVYPLHLRGTGESFAANIGGRMIGTAAALVTTNLVIYMPDLPGFKNDAVHFAYAAAAVGAGVYLIGLVTSFWLPEPAHEALPEQIDPSKA